MTRPLSLPPACTLWVDGVRYADGQPDEDDTKPVVLTDLSVTWGRSTTVDQPSPATASFRVLDVGGGERFTDRLHIGADVRVRADAIIYPDPTVSTISNPGFESSAVGSHPSTAGNNATVTVTSARAHAGTRSARIDPLDADRRVRVIFPPAPFSTDPAAWDAVPRTLLGQSWTYGASVWVPEYLSTVLAAAVVRPVTFTGPFPTAATVVDAAATVGAPDAGRWRVHTGVLTPTVADVWVGVAVDVYPTGPAWDDVPVAVAWDAAGTVTWDDVAASFVDDLVVLAPAAGAARSGAVFAGRITDMDAAYDEGIGGTIIEITAQDDTAELANRYIGGAPWPAETLAARFARIVTATLASGMRAPLNYTVDTAAGAPMVTYLDADSRPALGLMQDLAASVAGVLWSATSLATGPFLRLEDISSRPPLQILTRGADLIIRIVPAPVVGASGITLDACDVLLEPVHWVQDGTDNSTMVDVQWLDQTVVDGAVKPTTRTVSARDAPAELATGRRRVSVSAQLTVSTDAQRVADALLGRLSGGGWRVSGLTWAAAIDDALTPAKLDAVMRILDAPTRLGLPVMLVNLPDWSPVPAPVSVPLYVEGARLRNNDGAWTIELITSSAKAQGAGAVTWDALPASWQWDQFDPAISWNDLNGVGL
jgi:hypothetical protein